MTWPLHGETADAQEPARRIDGYRGIWFTLGQFYGPGTGDEVYSKASREPVFPFGDKYSGGLGTYTAKHTPLAIYCPAVDKTFFVYGGTTEADEDHLLCMISFYDHQTHRVPRPVIVHDKDGVNDPHDNPSLLVDADGHLWVFVSGRGRHRPGFKYRSDKPYSIERFTQISEEEMTYPQPHFLPQHGMLHLFTKYTGVRELYWEQSGDGQSWSDDRKLAGIVEPGLDRGGHYQTSATFGNRTGTFFNRHPDGIVDQRTDLYYVQSNDGGEIWTTIDGQVLETPITEVASPARVIDYVSAHRNVYLKDMGFDDHGHPVVLYLTSAGHEPGPPNNPRHFLVTRWDGEGWRTSTICATDHNYDMGSLYLGAETWKIRVPSDPGPQANHAGGEIVDWESRDRGETWRKGRTLTRGSSKNHNYARRPIHAKDPFHAFWADGDPTVQSRSHLYFADSTGRSVWRLPYEMTGEWAEPLPIDAEDIEND